MLGPGDDLAGKVDPPVQEEAEVLLSAVNLSRFIVPGTRTATSS